MYIYLKPVSSWLYQIQYSCIPGTPKQMKKVLCLLSEMIHAHCSKAQTKSH